jgi:hypothetical protein
VKLPDAVRAIVDRAKIVEYLLNAAHPDNGGKAMFFLRSGFSSANPDELATALRKVAANGDVVVHTESLHGNKYVVDGRLESPAGGRPFVRTVWIIDRGTDVPRLVTAYPSRE